MERRKKMRKTGEKASPLADDLSTIIPAIVNIQKLSLKDWCKRNNWNDFQSVQFQFYAIPPGGYIPVPLPREAFTLSDKYQQVFDVLWKIQFLEQTSRNDLDKALIFNVACVLVLLIKGLLKSSVAFVKIPTTICQLLDLSLVILIITTFTYFYVSLASYCKYCRSKQKLSGMPEITNLLASLKFKL